MFPIRCLRRCTLAADGELEKVLGKGFPSNNLSENEEAFRMKINVKRVISMMIALVMVHQL